jgi:pyruvate ferredoxin oxidoreductase gamma subunit
LLTVPATEFALAHVGRPVPSAVMLAGFAALSRVISLDAIESAIRHKFPAEIAERNVAAAGEAYRCVLDGKNRTVC